MAYGLLQTGPWLLSTITTLIILHARYCRALPFERSNQTTDERLNNHTALNMLGIACVSFCVYWTARIICQSSSEPYKFNTAASVSYIYNKYGHKHWVKLMFIFVCIIWGVKWERKKIIDLRELLSRLVLHHKQCYSLLFPAQARPRSWLSYDYGMMHSAKISNKEVCAKP